MGLNGNRFKTTRKSQPCPKCLGYPPLVVVDQRHVSSCETCGGLGTVPRERDEKAAPEGGSRDSQDDSQDGS